nr:MAG TPA: hypothetical protein [Caudoviricetes sp.]
MRDNKNPLFHCYDFIIFISFLRAIRSLFHK